MHQPLFKFEAGLLRVEKWILVGSVLLMLALAGYTVFYRNVLIPWQTHLATSGPPVTERVEPVDDAPADQAEPGDEAGEADDQGFGGGFGGGFGETEEAAEPEEEGGDFAGGFGGGFGDAAEEEAEPADDAEPEEEGGDFAGGFGGGFGDGGEEDAQEDIAGDEQETAEAEPATPSPKPVAQQEPATQQKPQGGPPQEGSFAARMVELIDQLKFHWLDVLLRQLVILCGFLGAMLATRQRSHITVDAVGKLLKGRTEHVVHTVTSLAAAVVCVFLALSGWDLVSIGREFPRQLIPWLDNWHFQLAFPIGWGLLSFHFVMRALESATLAAKYPEAAKHPEADTPHSEPHEEIL